MHTKGIPNMHEDFKSGMQRILNTKFTSVYCQTYLIKFNSNDIIHLLF